MRPLALRAAFVVLAACTGGEHNVAAAAGELAAAAPADRVDAAPGRGEANGDAALPSAGEGDACGAGRHQWLVGRPRSDIPPEPAGADWRITCTGCPITMDHRPERMNIFYGQRSGTIEQVRCG